MISKTHGPRKYQYRFLSHLGLNYFYWLDVDYLKATYGDNWEQAYKQAFDDFEFYHSQLKPFAEEILSAINEKQIQIYDDGTYSITDDLKERLESETIFQLRHPNEK